MKDILMSWVFQSTGPINMYNERIHRGTQPVRVVHAMITEMFRNTYSDFYLDLQEQIASGKLTNELNLVYGEDPIKIDNHNLRTPKINTETKTIELHETFLSYLWCCSYSLFVNYVETIDYPKVNNYVGYEKYKISSENIEEAQAVFNYAKYIISDFDHWDKTHLPNPEIYLAENRTYVEQTNLFYTEAVKFILCHEFTHLKMHVEQISESTSNSNYLVFEEEADNNAIDMMKKGTSMFPGAFGEAHKLAIENGIIFGILSMFFFKASTDGVKHPNSEDRLTNALERLELNEEHNGWAIACVGLKFWDEMFGINLTWEIETSSYKIQYYKLVEQIKAQ